MPEMVFLFSNDKILDEEGIEDQFEKFLTEISSEKINKIKDKIQQ